MWCVSSWEHPGNAKLLFGIVLSFHWECSRAQHRGVSAFSFRDGAIRLETSGCARERYGNAKLQFGKSFKDQKPGSHRGHREHGEKILSNAWERVLGTPNFSLACLLGTPTFKLACLERKKMGSHGAHRGKTGKGQGSLGKRKDKPD